MGIENKVDEFAGKAKEGIGNVTGNDKLEAEGQADQVQSKIAQGVDKVKETFEGVKESFSKDN